MLTNFAQEKETFVTTKKQFFKVVNPCFWSKNAFFSLFTFDENKTRNNVW